MMEPRSSLAKSAISFLMRLVAISTFGGRVGAMVEVVEVRRWQNSIFMGDR